MSEKREVVESSRVWEKLGDHGGRLNALEASKIQNEQSIINVRAEVNGHIKGLEDKLEQSIHEINRDIKECTATIMAKIGKLTKFQITIIAGGAVVGVMVLGMFSLAAWLLINFGYIKALFN
jgi:hypothetical protein